MAKFGEEFTYNSINIKPFYRLPVGNANENVILINDGRNSVVKVRDRKLLESWTLAHPHHFTAPVIYDTENEALFSVMNDKILLKWSEDEDLSSAIKSEFKKPIFALLPIPNCFSVIVFTSGKVIYNQIIAPYSKPLGTAFLDKEEEIVWADAVSVTQHPGVTIVCLGYSNLNKTYKLHWFSLMEKSVCNYNKYNLEGENRTLKNWCLNKCSDSFLSIWSDGTVLKLSLDNQVESVLMKVPDVTKESIVAIDSIDANHVGLIKSNPNSKEAYLEIWDSKFTALKARKVLKTRSPNSIQLNFIGSSVFISCNGELTEISFHVEKSTLAAVIGRSPSVSSKVQEFTWNKGKMSNLEKTEQKVEEMDTSESETKLTSTELIAQRLMDGGSDCLNYIPESELVRLLRLAIRYKGKEKSKTSIQPDVILNAVFSASFSDVVLVKFMKKLSLEDTMAALEVLMSFLTNTESTTTLLKRPSDLQVFNWICLVLQSHMEGLLLAKDKERSKLLQKLDSCLSEKMKEYEDYESIKHLVLVIQKKNNFLPEKYVVGKYCIETLDT